MPKPRDVPSERQAVVFCQIIHSASTQWLWRCRLLLKELLPNCSSLHVSILGASILFFKTSEPGSALLILFRRSTDPFRCPRILWTYIAWGWRLWDRQPGLGAVRLWKKSLPFLLSFLGIYFMFVDFVFFSRSGSLLMVNKDKREVVPQKKPLLWFQSLDMRTYSEMVSLLKISSQWHQCLNLKVVGCHYFGNLFKPGICSARTFYPLGAWKLDCWGSSLSLLGCLKPWLQCIFWSQKTPEQTSWSQ